ncbi:hypothetical protein HYPSUDRAFT_208502 [Hypholoma sublateritium FD-334 SS-4]|uniref:Uncharacterized protein n=1 Tax=Hypholoma sublateritium (strain FD-334 SS-4) TaxID=945553 RepID=A0A0D2P281_HYPSF|nr:hypothetical protein HYPSUDRAFT_208502 [Hypholoma sublateritium FD-334 SS-4]
MTPPQVDGLSPEATARAVHVYEMQKAELKMRKDIFKRRLAYQYNKTKSPKVKVNFGSSDPLAVLSAKISGNSIQKPRQKTAYNVWGPHNHCFVDPVFNDAIYKELFEELPKDEQQEWIECAAQEHREALKKASTALKSEPSTAPEDCQRPISIRPAHPGPNRLPHWLEGFANRWRA